ncbi:MAG TPA: bifunctional UDP-sugar hydrolase/5'-nucleotidase [Mobilitalea sp.]|nr:bifunctional UDP-sugar hydrolase/5'-nucleotidase [Mobilitalea sp.]
MKKILKYSFLFFISVALLLQSVSIPKALAAEQENSLTILFTHDLHDYLLPLKTLENGNAISVGGYARLMTAIKEQKEKKPNTILVDAGDFSMGTPFQTIFQTDAPELRMLGAMGYDVVTLGNHEFDYRPQGLTGSLRAALTSGEKLPQIVQSNMTFPTDEAGNLTESLSQLKQAIEDYGFKDYTIIERNGYKIGIFGVMGEEAVSTAPMAEVTFANAVESAKRVVKILKDKENVDLIVCLSHSGTNKEKASSEDEILAKEVPEINVIISGHSHTELQKPIVVGNTIIGSCGDYGRNLGVIDLALNDNNTWDLDNYELVQINDSFVEDNAISQKVASFKELVQQKYFDKFGLNYDEVVATSDIQFQTPGDISSHHAEATIGNLISDAYIYAVKKAEGADYEPVAAAIVPCGTIRGTIFTGDITVADAFSISSLGIGADQMPGYPLISVYLTGKELKTACEVDASIAPLMGDAQLFMSGVNFTFNPNRFIFNKVTKVTLTKEDGSAEKIDDSKLYRVVCGLYSAQMLSIVGEKSYGLMSIVPKNKNGDTITNFEDYIIYDKVDGMNRELKEWYAMVQYLQSFDKVDGVPKVPVRYQAPEGRKVVDNNKNIIAILSKPSHIALTVYILLPSILALFILLNVVLIRHGRKKRKARKEKLQY